MRILIVTGTGTGVGKTVVTAALAATARERGERVAVVKPAQTGTLPGDPGDLEDVSRLAGITDLHEHARFPAALSPDAAARHANVPPLRLEHSAPRIRELARHRDLVLVEGAGGLLVRYDGEGTTIADLAREVGAPVLVVTHVELGCLNAAALTLEALASRQLDRGGLVIGSWPDDPDLTTRSNAADLKTIAGGDLTGWMPAGAGTFAPSAFLATARCTLLQ